MNIRGKIFDNLIVQLYEAITVGEVRRKMDEVNINNIRLPRPDYCHNTNSFLQQLRRIEMLSTVRSSDRNVLVAAIRTYIIRMKFAFHKTEAATLGTESNNLHLDLL